MEHIEGEIDAIKAQQKAKTLKMKDEASDQTSRRAKRMSKQFANYSDMLSEASGMDFMSEEGSGKMNPKEIEESIKGFEQEIEPTIPRRINKYHKVSVDPVTGDPIIQREVKPKKEKGQRKKGE